MADIVTELRDMGGRLPIAAADEIDRLRSEVISFCGPHAARHAEEHGLPPGHLHPVHYDILARAGARMVDFVRHEENANG